VEVACRDGPTFEDWNAMEVFREMIALTHVNLVDFSVDNSSADALSLDLFLIKLACFENTKSRLENNDAFLEKI